jgi:hypothetical protein
MSGMLAKALSALIKRNEGLAHSAETVGRLVTMRPHRREQAVDLATGLKTYRMTIEFPSEAELSAFHAALADLSDRAVGGDGE